MIWAIYTRFYFITLLNLAFYLYIIKKNLKKKFNTNLLKLFL